MRRTVQVPGGQFAVEERGDPAGWPVLVHHGTPSCGRSAFYGPWVRDAAARGLRLIGYDWPGDWFAGQNRGDAEDSRRYLTDPVADRKKLDQDRDEYLSAPLGEGPDDSALAPEYAAAVRGGFHGFMLARTQAALAPGSQGWWSDKSMTLRPRWFDDDGRASLAQHRVPEAHAWLAGQRPGG